MVSDYGQANIALKALSKDYQKLEAQAKIEVQSLRSLSIYTII